MSWIDDTVTAYGQGLGINRLALPRDGALELNFERRGTLALEQAGEDLLIYLARDYPFAPRRVLVDALSLCHWRHNRPFEVRAAMREDRIVLLIRLQGREVSVATLERSVDLLSQLHDQLSA